MPQTTSNYKIQTPNKYVTSMLDIVGYNYNIIDSVFLENSFGEGNILVEAVKRYINECFRIGIPHHEIAKRLETHFVGFETDLLSFKTCIQRLNGLLSEYNLPYVKWNCRNVDFLKTDTIKVDYIVGNPPYITYNDLTVDERSFIKNNFKTCKKGRFDYCYCFIEKSLNCLNSNGSFSYLVPYSIFTNKYADALREKLKPYLTYIIDYRNETVFNHVVCTPVLIIGKRNYKKETFKWYNNKVNRGHTISKSKLGKSWNFYNSTKNTDMVYFGDFFDVKNAVATLKNAVFIFSPKHEDDNYYYNNCFKIEKQLVKKAVSVSSIKYKYSKYILFPYKLNAGKISRFEESELKRIYPFSYEYLKAKEHILKSRKLDKNTNWYEFGRRQALDSVFYHKLIIPNVLTRKVTAFPIDKETVPYAGIFIVQRKNCNFSLNLAKKILESHSFFDYIQKCGTPTTTISYRISVNNILSYKFPKSLLNDVSTVHSVPSATYPR